MCATRLHASARGPAKGISLLTGVLLMLLVLPTCEPTPPPPAQSSFVGSATIPPGQHNVGILDPRITAASTIILTVDTTTLHNAQRDVAGIKLNNVGPGFLTVTTLDLSDAPDQGLPFNYLVVRDPASSVSQDGQTLTFTAGTARMRQGHPNVGVNNKSVTPTSLVLLTVNARKIENDVKLPGLKVNNHGDGFFTVTTLDLSDAPSSFEFNYLIVNPPAAGAHTLAGTAVMGASDTLERVANPGVSTASALFLTVDASRFPDDRQLPGLEVGLHGRGFFTAATSRRASHGSSVLPFNWLALRLPEISQFQPQITWGDEPSRSTSTHATCGRCSPPPTAEACSCPPTRAIPGRIWTGCAPRACRM